jgi:hypothetical protein
MGRSTGYGSLMINTHSFKETKFVKSYSGPGSYKGSAAIVGAGVQGRELYRQAFKQDPKVVIVGGECPVRDLAICRRFADINADCRMGGWLRPGRWSWTSLDHLRNGCR